MHTICVGGGPAGLYLAILLKRQAPFDEVTVCERNARGHSPGWGIVYWDDLLRRLSRADPQSAWKIRAASRRWSGQALLRNGRETRHDSEGGYALERRRLLEILAERAAELGGALRQDLEQPAAFEGIAAFAVMTGLPPVPQQRLPGPAS